MKQLIFEVTITADNLDAAMEAYAELIDAAINTSKSSSARVTVMSYDEEEVDDGR